jgi:hypothetical protein
MFVDEGDAGCGELSDRLGCEHRLTIRIATLNYKRNDHVHSQGNYDYQAHPHVLPGGADPLESQGFASVTSGP